MQPLISSAEALDEVLPTLAAQDRIAIDTEADSLHSYFEKLCLVQISVPEHDLLVDPLAGFPLEPLFTVFDGKELILHGADYDLRLLRRVGYTRPTRLFDTMIAARLCGVTEFSLAALIFRYFGIQLTKASQKANWARRPLSPQMSEYAVNDTRFLLQIADILRDELRRLGRLEWFEQSCERAIASSTVKRERDPDQLWRITGSHELVGRATAVLRALWEWREQEAQAVDRPTFHILHNEQLIEAADRLDRGLRLSVDQLRGPRRERFFQAGERGLALPETEWPKAPPRRPRLPRPSPEQEQRLRDFRQKRDSTATDLQLDPALIAPKSVLERLAADPDEAAAQLLPWQRTALGL